MRRQWLWLVLICGVCGLAAQHLQNSPPVAPVDEGSGTPSPALTPDLGGGASASEDLIVTHLEYAAGKVSVHVQNQGPARLSGVARLKLGVDGRTQDVEVECPREPLQVAASGPINLSELDLDPENFVEIFRVDTPTGRNFFEQISVKDGVVEEARPPYPVSAAGGGLPDLVIEDCYYDGADYLKVVYRNQGQGMTGSDFLVSLRSGEHRFDGNHYYRFPVPPPGKRMETGGFTLGLIGLRPGQKAGVVAVIDPEGRVRESDRSNNTWQGEVVLRQD